MGDTLRDILCLKGYSVQWVGNGSDALKIINKDDIDVVLLDLLLPGMNGIEVLKRIFHIDPYISVIMMSGHGTIQTALETTQLGAYDWLEKPLEKDRVFLTIRNAIEKSTLLSEKEVLLSEVKTRYRMVGTSSAMKTVYQLIDKVALQNIRVLITGESGTGKDLVAHAIHLNSQRASTPFIHVNCAAVPETLIESELFGHKKGAFTGAISDKKGKFQIANRGTIFLDEIGDLSNNAQAKILRTIETGEVQMVGSEQVENVDVRLISATNKNLPDLISKGAFREDLFHRINVIEINILPLRERTDDILPLTDYFLEMFCTHNNVKKKMLTSSAETVLLSYNWPGNVRELRNLAEKIVVLVDTPKVNGHNVADLLEFSIGRKVFDGVKTFKQAKKSFEKSYIANALWKNEWKISKTAETLDMTRSSLYDKIKEYGIKQDSEKPDK
jgi:two-component system nitrogen regulation response regulator NtrX